MIIPPRAVEMVSKQANSNLSRASAGEKESGSRPAVKSILRSRRMVVEQPSVSSINDNNIVPSGRRPVRVANQPPAAQICSHRTCFPPFCMVGKVLDKSTSRSNATYAVDGASVGRSAR